MRAVLFVLKLGLKNYRCAGSAGAGLVHLDMLRAAVCVQLYLRSGLHLVALLGIAVLVTYSPQNGIILLVIAFLVSPVGLPMAAAWLVGKVQDLRYVIQDAVYG